MPAMQYPKILAFVEGTMERLFVNNSFRYVELVQISNGKSWTAEMMALQISSKFRAKDYDADYIVVWIDCEKRACATTYLATKITEALVESGASPEKIVVCIPDKMTENVILADETLIRLEFDDPNYSYTVEGQNGKHVLKTMYHRRSINYKETAHGVALLKKVRMNRLSASCLSGVKFSAALGLACWWFQEPA